MLVSPPPRTMPSPPRVGSRAPDFAVSYTLGQAPTRGEATLAGYQGRWLALLFYPRDFSLVCPTELVALSEKVKEFHRRDCDLLAVSTDSLEQHEKWINTPRLQGGVGQLNYPLGADDGAMCEAYGVLIGRQRTALRGLFLIDPNGVLQYQVVHNLSVGRRADEVLRVLDALQTGGLCAEDWVRGQAPIDPTHVLGADSVVGNFRIEAQVGSGAFGAVYRALDTTLERLVALKILRVDSPVALEGLIQEARSAAALNHPNICTIYAVGSFDGVSMIVMEYLEGDSLSSVLKAGPLPKLRAMAIGRQLAEGMAAAHEAGVVHGDLKPGNVMFTRGHMAKIMDFGLARRKGSDLAATMAIGLPEGVDGTLDGGSGGLSGTPAYMSPEQARGRPPGPASDVFTLGLIFYEMLTGRRAIQADNLFSALSQIQDISPESFGRQLPEPFATLVTAALRPNPAERMITMAQIASRLSSSVLR